MLTAPSQIRASSARLATPGACDLGDDTASGAEEVAQPAQQCDGVAADPDVAVEQQRRAPPSRTGEGIEDRTVERPGLLAARARRIGLAR